MGITFTVTEAHERHVHVGSSALLEAAISLHVLSDPRHHPYHHPWVRAMRRLSPGLRRELRALRFVTSRIWPVYLAPAPGERFVDPDSEWSRFAALPAERLATAMLRPLYTTDRFGPTDPGWRDERDATARVLRRAGFYGAEAQRAARILLERPERGVERFRSALRAYWDEAFAAEWLRIAPVVEEAERRLRAEVRSGGLFAVLQRYSARVDVDVDRRAFGFSSALHEHAIAVGPTAEIVLVPTVYGWPHVSLNCDDEWPRGLVVPVPLPGTTVRAPTAPRALARSLAAVADPGRLQLLRLLLDRPRSTQELAPLVNLTEQGVSKQLRLLADVGLVRARREGYYVVYAVETGAVGQLEHRLQEFLAEPLEPVDRPSRATGPGATPARGRRPRRL